MCVCVCGGGGGGGGVCVSMCVGQFIVLRYPLEIQKVYTISSSICYDKYLDQ